VLEDVGEQTLLPVRRWQLLRDVRFVCYKLWGELTLSSKCFHATICALVELVESVACPGGQ